MKNGGMAPPKKNGGKTPENRKPSRMCRIRERLAKQVDIAIERLETDFTEWVNAAVREKLAAEGLWPPKDEAED